MTLLEYCKTRADARVTCENAPKHLHDDICETGGSVKYCSRCDDLHSPNRPCWCVEFLFETFEQSSFTAAEVAEIFSRPGMLKALEDFKAI